MSGEVAKKAPAKRKTPKKEVAAVEVMDQSRIDYIIETKVGHLPVREIAELTGLKPEQVMNRKRELLDSVDELSEAEKRQQLMQQLLKISQKVWSDYENAPYEFKAGIANSAIAGIKESLKEINRADVRNADAINKLNELRKKELLRIVEVSVVQTSDTLSEMTGVPADEILDVFKKALREAAQEADNQ